MPMLTIVSFTDEDGDEFPIALVGIPASDEAAERIARERIEEIREDEPRFPASTKLVMQKIEYPGSWAVAGRCGPLGRDLTLQGARELARVSGGTLIEMYELGEEI